MKMTKNICLYVSSIILVIIYFIILYISMKPNVSWEYMLYYIKQETDTWPGNNGYNYEIGTKIEPRLENSKECKRFGKGWGEFTEEGVWSVGEKSSIYFGNLPNEELIFEMEIAECSINEDIEVYFNDKLKERIDSKELANEKKIIQNVEKEDIIEGKLVVTLKYTETEENIPKILCKEINLYEI